MESRPIVPCGWRRRSSGAPHAATSGPSLLPKTAYTGANLRSSSSTSVVQHERREPQEHPPPARALGDQTCGRQPHQGWHHPRADAAPNAAGRSRCG